MSSDQQQQQPSAKPRRFLSSAAWRSAYATTPTLGNTESQRHWNEAKKDGTADSLPTAPTALFRKPLTTSARTPIKSKEVKKLRETMKKIFKALTEKDLTMLLPAKCSVHTEKLSGSTLTEAGLKPLIYWVHSGEGGGGGGSKGDMGEPLFIDLSGGHADAHMVYPTIYAFALLAKADAADSSVSSSLAAVTPATHRLLRPLIVHAPVSKFVMAGADCMWPGVVSTGEESKDAWDDDDTKASADSTTSSESGGMGMRLGRFRRGEKRALFVRGNPIPFAVGWLSQASGNVISSGVRGPALSIVHVFQDELWKIGSMTQPNQGFTKKMVYPTIIQDEEDENEEDDGEEEEAGEERQAAEEEKQDDSQKAESDEKEAPPKRVMFADEVSEEMEELNVEDAILVGEPASTSASASASATDAAESDEDEDEEQDAADTAAASSSASASTLTRIPAAEMDAALLRSFLFAVQTRINDSDLPMDPSALLSHMELCNIEPFKLDPRQSSAKKLSKVLKNWVKMGLLKAKVAGGKPQTMCHCEFQIMSVSRTSPLFADAVVTPAYLEAVRKKEKAKAKAHAQGAAAAAAAAATAGGSEDAVATGASSSSSGGAGRASRSPQILHMYKVDHHLQRLLFPDDEDASKKLFHSKDIKQLLWDYVKDHDLDSGSKVKLDNLLLETLYFDSQKKPVEATKHELSQRVDRHLVEHHSIVLPGQDVPDVKWVRGPPPTIEVNIEQRQGRKMMTRVHGLEAFGISPATFAKEGQKLFASSCTTQTVTIKQKTREEVLIQGNVAADVANKLQQLYAIPTQYVKVLPFKKK